MTESKLNTPLVSVIVPCYNNAQHLAEALESVYAQTYANWECIIMDDGSTDTSKEVALSYTEKDDRFKYVYQENKGVSVARNNAIGKSQGKYILPLDADDKISNRYMEGAINVLETKPDIKVVYCKSVLFGKKNAIWEIPPYSYKQLLIENLIFCTAFFRREDFNKTAGYDKDMVEGFEDWDFWISFLSEADKVYQIPEVHFYYRLKDTSRNTELEETKQRRLRRFIYEKHKDVYTRYFSFSDIMFDYYIANNNYLAVRYSMIFKIGNIILWPYHALRKIFQ